jgi:hypothetical protein
LPISLVLFIDWWSFLAFLSFSASGPIYDIPKVLYFPFLVLITQREDPG